MAFRDTDADVEQRVGKPIAEIFYDDGEERFRELQRAAVATALAEHDGVLSLGGGACSRPRHAGPAARPRRRAARGRPVGRRAARRAVARPAGARAEPAGAAAALLDERLPLYREVASRTVTTDGRTPAEVADEVLAAC